MNILDFTEILLFTGRVLSYLLLPIIKLRKCQYLFKSFTMLYRFENHEYL
jgi:hypothetical protein